MRIFTLGKEGISLFLFAFILLTGSLPSYGQENCPTPGNTPSSQAFCYLSTVSDINTDGNAIYRTEDATNPIPSDELLQDETYYVGNEAGTCTNRIAVAVDVTTLPAPNPTNGLIFSPPISSASEVYEINDVIEFVSTTDPSYELVVYQTEYGTSTYAATDDLVAGQSYFIGQTETGNPCYSQRIAVRYSPDLVEAPTATSPQTFCEGATVADLVAEGTSPDTQAIRWYSTADSNPELEATTLLVDGETYYASQIVNDEGDPFPPTESEDRVGVLVQLESANAGNDNTNAEACLSEIQARLAGGESAEDIFLGLLDSGVPTDGTFSPSISDLAADYSANPIGTFSTTYTITNAAGCEDSVELALTIVEDYDAGDDNTTTELCRSELEDQLTETQVEDYFRSLLSADADPNGSFSSDSITEITNTFNNGDGIGTFSTVYTVGAGTSCEDTANFTVTITEADAGNDNIDTELCQAELEALLENQTPQEIFLGLLDPGVPTDGTFEPSIDELVDDYSANPFQTFATTYTITNAEGCEGSVDLAITVTETANAGPDTDLVFCESEVEALVNEFLADPTQDAEIFLAEWIGDRDTNGTFSGDPLQSILSQYTSNSWPIEVSTTYTVGTGTECEDAAEISLTITEGGDTVADNSATICNADVNVLFEQVPEDVRDYYIELAGGTTGGTFEPSIEDLVADYAENNIDDFTTTYTVGEGTDCEDSAVLTVTVTDELPADAGDDRTLTFCTAEGSQDLADFITPGANEDGTFTGDLDQNFDPATVGAGTYNVIYTVDDSSACVIAGDEDTASFTVTITEGGDTVADNSATICNADVNVLFEQVPEDVRDYYIELAGGTTGGTFEPTIEELVADYGENNIGDFTTTYTVGEGTDCEDSAVLTVTVTDELPADAGDDRTLTFCTAEGSQDLADFITPGANEDGTFTGDLDQNFDPATVGVGIYNVIYTVDDSSACVIAGDEDTASFTITITEGGNAVADNSATICNADVNVLFEQVPEDVRDYYIELAGGTTGGTFEPTIEELVADYGENNIGDFTTTYTVGEGTDCESSAVLTITVNPETPADAGDIVDQTYCSTEEPVTLSSLIPSGATTGGTFTGEGVENGMFDPSVAGVGTFTITYFVDDTANCVTDGTEDETTFEIEVLEGGDAGQDNSTQYCYTEIPDLVGNDAEADVRQLYLDLLSAGVPTNGTFSPSIPDIIADYNTDHYQDFTTTYTVGEGVCEDSVELTITVNPIEDANAGTIANQTLCSTAGPLDLGSLLDAAATTGGEFSGTGVENGMFDPSVAGLGTFTITYFVDDTANCVTDGTEDETTFEIEVIQGPDAGEDAVVNLTEEETDPVDLFEALGGTPDADGIWTDEAGTMVDGTFDPTTEMEGVFTYTVSSPNGCEDSATVTIVVGGDQTTCPEITNPEQFFFCSTNATVADLLPANVVWYADEDATEALASDTVLEDGEDYFAGNENGTCETRGMVTVDLGNVGLDNGITYCHSEIPARLDEVSGDVEQLFLNLLEDGASTDGTFNPAIQVLVDRYNDNPIGEFQTTYTSGEGECMDSAVLTVTVVQDPDAGEDAVVNLTEEETDPVDLFEALGGTPDADGIWTDEAGTMVDGTFDPTTEMEGVFTYTVSSPNGCEDTATVTVVIGQDTDCPEITDATQSFCGADATVADLLPADAVWYESATATTALASDAVLVDGEDYFAGTADDSCQTRGMVIVNFTDAPAAPEVTDASFCTVEGATVADLEVVGDNIAFYTNEEMSTPAAMDDVLVDGVYYVTQASDEGCESEAAMLTVTLTDGAAPTLSPEEKKLCDFNNPTIADLENNIVEDGTIVWYDAATGGNVLNTSEPLENGVTYYAALIDDTLGCESSERLAITASLDCPVVIPEAFSPNGDEINDLFVIQGIAAEYPNYTIEIYNRWGTKVYEGNAGTPFWDGVAESAALGDDVLPVGVYFYVLRYNDGQTAPTQGRLYLSR